MRRSTLWLALFLLALGPGQAHAQQLWDMPSSRGFELVPRTGIGASIGFWTAGNSGRRIDSMSGYIMGGLVLDDLIEVSLVAGWAFASLDSGLTGLDDDGTTSSNPEVNIRLIGGERRWRLSGGLAFTIPTISRTGDARLAAYFAATSRSAADIWRWTPSRTSLIPAFTLEAVPIDLLYVGASLRLGVMIEVEDAPVVPVLPDQFGTHRIRPSDPMPNSAGDVDLSAQADVTVGLVTDNFFAGLRLRGVYLPTLGEAPFQTSADLVARGYGEWPDSTLSLFGEVRLMTTLNEPLGFGFWQLGSWGLFFSLGASTTSAQIADGRFGVRSVSIEGAEQLDGRSVVGCLGTRPRSRLEFDLFARNAPDCNAPPFDGTHVIIDPWSWPWTEWPLFDATVFERDVERIERWYRARGFYEARVVSTEVDPPAAAVVAHNTRAQCGSEEDDDCTVEVTFRLEEGEPVHIARMALRGLDELPEEMRARLRAALLFERGDIFDELLYERTKRDMQNVLANRGYAHARVLGEVKINERRREAFLIFKIEAGHANVIGRVCVRGYRNLPPETILAVADLNPGAEFSREAIEDAQRALYSLGAFGRVEVSPDVEAAHAEADAEGPEINEDSITGSSGRPVVAADQVETEFGETEDVHCSAAPSDVPSGREAVDINIRVEPGRTTRLGFGVGFQAGQAVTFGSAASLDAQQNAAQWDLHIAAALEHRNLFDRLIRARLEVRPRLIFQMPLFNFEPAQDPPFGILTTLGFSVPGLVLPTVNLVLRVRWDLGPMPFTNFFRSELDGVFGPEGTAFDGHLYAALFLHGNWFFPTDRQPVEPTHQLPETGSLWIEEILRLDFRDNPARTTEGFYFSLNAQQSVQPFSSWDLLRVVGEVRAYATIRDAGIVFAGRFQMGATEVFGVGDNLDPNNIYRYDILGPPALHLSGGGASSNRGFLPGLLGDSEQVYVQTARTDQEIENGTPIRRRPVRIQGGTRSWLLSLEVRFSVTPDLGIVVFGDAGDVNRDRLADPTDDADWRFAYPQIAIGLGLRYLTIIGPLRVDFAIRVNELQVIGQSTEFGDLPPTCATDGASNCNPRNNLNFGFAQVPGAFHLTIGESF